MYQMFTHAPAGTPSNAQPGARYTQQDTAFMAAMFPRQFAQAPVPPPVLQQAVDHEGRVACNLKFLDDCRPKR